ncbi:MAG: SAM hydroxide adenosyltransferase [Patescibacteria group bacterium]
MKKLIVIADWAHDSLTCQEIISSVEGSLKKNSRPYITFVASTPSTVHTSYLINQVVETEERLGKPKDTVIFQNTDPRLQTKKGVEQSKGADFIIIELQNGMFLCGPNAGYDFSMIKNKIKKIYKYKDLDKGSQFRSRDLYSKASAQLMEERAKEMDLIEITKASIPDFNGYFVGHIDNYGNIKTTIKLSDFKKNKIGDKINIKLNDALRVAEFATNLFGAEPGKLVIYPGSSGEKDDPYLEISVWRHFTEDEKTTGTHEFNNPLPGDKILITS